MDTMTAPTGATSDVDEPAPRALLPHTGPMTTGDLDAMPDDGRRYELIDGVLFVSPAPGTRHQVIGYELYGVLDDACPDDFAVLGAPYAVHIGESIELQPDVLVGRIDDFTAKDLPVPPVLAVEVASPSTALHDRNTKKAAYERMGVPRYWVIDPDEPRLTVFALIDDGYREAASVVGDEGYDADLPFPVRIVPIELLGRFRDRL